jgi:hypothetical protein
MAQTLDCARPGVHIMLALQVAKLGQRAAAFPGPAFFERQHAARRFGRPGPRLAEATKAGLGAAVGSLIILAFMLLVLHTLPVGIG